MWQTHSLSGGVKPKSMHTWKKIIDQGKDIHPPAEQSPSARRSSNVVCSTDVSSDADKPAAPRPPKLQRTAEREVGSKQE